MIDLLPNFMPYNRYSSYPEPEPLTTAPDYVRTRNATRWHRARSGVRHHDGRISYGYWCGANYGDFGEDTIPEGDPVCGTCEGRFLAQQDSNVWRFDPISSVRPRMCPASRSQGLVPPNAGRWFPCPACGEHVRGWATSRWYSGWAIVRHEAGPDLIDPCRYHGWAHLRLDADGRAVCACSLATEAAS